MGYFWRRGGVEAWSRGSCYMDSMRVCANDVWRRSRMLRRLAGEGETCDSRLSLYVSLVSSSVGSASVQVRAGRVRPLRR